MRKGPGKEAKLCYGAHALMENRNGLLIDLMVSQPTGSAQRKQPGRDQTSAAQRREDKKPGRRQRVRHHDFVGFLRGQKVSRIWRAKKLIARH